MLVLLLGANLLIKLHLFVGIERENTTFDGPWIQEVSREELLSAFDDWEPEVSALLQVNLVPIIGQAILRTFPVTVHPIAE